MVPQRAVRQQIYLRIASALMAGVMLCVVFKEPTTLALALLGFWLWLAVASILPGKGITSPLDLVIRYTEPFRAWRRNLMWRRHRHQRACHQLGEVATWTAFLVSMVGFVATFILVSWCVKDLLGGVGIFPWRVGVRALAFSLILLGMTGAPCWFFYPPWRRQRQQKGRT